jgi:hypothetical protein
MLFELPSFEMLGTTHQMTVSHHRRLVPLSVSIMEIIPMILVFAQYKIICHNCLTTGNSNYLYVEINIMVHQYLM